MSVGAYVTSGKFNLNVETSFLSRVGMSRRFSRNLRITTQWYYVKAMETFTFGDPDVI